MVTKFHNFVTPSTVQYTGTEFLHLTKPFLSYFQMHLFIYLTCVSLFEGCNYLIEILTDSPPGDRNQNTHTAEGMICIRNNTCETDQSAIYV